MRVSGQFYFFTRFHRHKKHKKGKKHKQHQLCKQATFFLLDVFYGHKKHKSTKRQTSDFLPLTCFYAYKNAVFFVSHTKSTKGT